MKEEQYPDGQEWIDYRGYFIVKDGNKFDIVLGMPNEKGAKLLDSIGIQEGLPACRRFIDGFNAGCTHGGESRAKLIRKALGL